MAATKYCPYCGEEILAVAIKCKHCKSDLTEAVSISAAEKEEKKPTIGLQRTPRDSMERSKRGGFGYWVVGLVALLILVSLIGGDPALVTSDDGWRDISSLRSGTSFVSDYPDDQVASELAIAEALLSVDAPPIDFLNSLIARQIMAPFEVAAALEGTELPASVNGPKNIRVELGRCSIVFSGIVIERVRQANASFPKDLGENYLPDRTPAEVGGRIAINFLGLTQADISETGEPPMFHTFTSEVEQFLLLWDGENLTETQTPNRTNLLGESWARLSQSHWMGLNSVGLWYLTRTRLDGVWPSRPQLRFPATARTREALQNIVKKCEVVEGERRQLPPDASGDDSLDFLANYGDNVGSSEEVAERITRFSSDITIGRDGTLTVQEDISVNAQRNQIQRGIFRDIPTNYVDEFGNRYRVGFDVQRVMRDGRDETYTLENISNGRRLRMGDSEVFLTPGIHEYTIVYTTTPQIGFFEDFDSLYWNVTGNGWAFAIDSAEALIRLPGENIEEFEVYTGAEGATSQDASAIRLSADSVRFVTTRPLGPQEGLTITVSFPKGIVAPQPPIAELPIQPFTPLGNENQVFESDYPAISIRLRETGLTVVNVCVEASGGISEVTLAQSSGHGRLDEAALRIVKERFQFNPATQGGTPVRHCGNQPIRFNM